MTCECMREPDPGVCSEPCFGPQSAGGHCRCGDGCKCPPNCPTDGVCPPCREGIGHWGGRFADTYSPTVESLAARAVQDAVRAAGWPRPTTGTNA